MTFVSLLYAYTGLTLLCLAMTRHFRQVWNCEPSVRGSRWLRVLGWMFIAAALIACVGAGSWSLGLVGWAGALTAAALVLIFLLPYRPKTAVALAGVAPIVATVLIGLA